MEESINQIQRLTCGASGSRQTTRLARHLYLWDGDMSSLVPARDVVTTQRLLPCQPRILLAVPSLLLLGPIQASLVLHCRPLRTYLQQEYLQSLPNLHQSLRNLLLQSLQGLLGCTFQLRGVHLDIGTDLAQTLTGLYAGRLAMGKL